MELLPGLESSGGSLGSGSSESDGGKDSSGVETKTVDCVEKKIEYQLKKDKVGERVGRKQHSQATSSANQDQAQPSKIFPFSHFLL